MPDTVARYNYLTATDSIITSREVRRYYADGLAQYSYPGASTQANGADSTRFDALGRSVFYQEASFNADSNQFVPVLRVRYFPHGTGAALDSFIVATTDFQTGALAPVYRANTTVFDANDRVQEERHFSWLNDAWILNSRTLFTYSTTGKEVSSQDENWDGASWAPRVLRQSFYDTNDSLVLQTAKNLPDSAYLFKAEFAYDLALHIRTNDQFSRENSAWVPQISIVEDFDAEGRYERYQVTYSVTGGINGTRSEYHYRADGCLWLIDKFSTQDGQNWSFASRTYYYDSGTVPVREPLAANQWSAYPNPAGAELWLEAPAGSPVRMTDFQGRTLYTGSAQGKERLDLTRFPAVFFLTVGEGRAATTRIILRNL